MRRRRAAGLSVPPITFLMVKAVALTALLEFRRLPISNLGRGVPWMFGFFVLLAVVLKLCADPHEVGPVDVRGRRQPRGGTPLGHQCPPHLYLGLHPLLDAGGRSAHPGGARLATSSQQAGTGDVNLNAIAAAVIGGTSLSGGRGSAYSALLGIIVIQAISNGLTLLNLSSSLRYMITGGVLAIAVIVDSLARRSRVSHGRA